MTARPPKPLMTVAQRESWEKIRLNGKFMFALKYGVGVWGGLVAVFTSMFFLFFTPSVAGKEPYLVMAIFSVAAMGFAWASVLWNLLESRYQRMVQADAANGR